MLISRTPLRISIGGGGTDLPSYYEKYGGCVISAAIDKYIFVAVNRMFTPEYVLKYSSLERVETIDQVQHPIFREVMRSHKLKPGVEIISLADVPAGTGLGSSGSFTVGLLRAMYALRCEYASAASIAEEACKIEMGVLGRAIGKQDQFIASFGGLTCFDFASDGTVRVTKLDVSRGTMSDLTDRLLMFFTGYSRNATEVLSDQKTRTEQGDATMIENLHFIKQIGLEVREALEAGDTLRFGELMHEHWLHKRARSVGMSNGAIDRWYDLARANGAVGGKLIGAGGGGFLLFYTEDPARLRKALTADGLQEMRFQFDHDGSSIICRD